MRAVVLTILALWIGGCGGFQTPEFTPKPHDPAYHCFDKDGNAIVDAQWCFPLDGTHTCCTMANTHCSMSGCDPDQGFDPAFYGARRSLARAPERP